MLRVSIGVKFSILVLSGMSGKEISARRPFIVGFPTTLTTVFGDEQTVCVEEIEFELIPCQYMDKDMLIMDVPPKMVYNVEPYTPSIELPSYDRRLSKGLFIPPQVENDEHKDYIIITLNPSEND